MAKITFNIDSEALRLAFKKVADNPVQGPLINAALTTVGISSPHCPRLVHGPLKCDGDDSFSGDLYLLTEEEASQNK